MEVRSFAVSLALIATSALVGFGLASLFTLDVRSDDAFADKLEQYVADEARTTLDGRDDTKSA